MKRTRKRQAGFTLVELMISLTIFSFVVAGILSVAVTMTNAFREHRQTLNTQDAVRGSMELIADAIRNASPAVSDSTKIESLLDSSGNCSSGAITMVNSTTGPDALDLVYAAGGVLTTIATSSSFPTATSTAMTVTDATNLSAGDYILITSGATGHVVKVTKVTGNALTLQENGCTATQFPVGGYPAGSFVIRARRARFYIGTFDGNPNTLMMKPEGAGSTAVLDEPLADNVEDFQVAIGVDVNADKGIGTGEWEYASGTGALAGPIRAVRITIVARTADAVTGVTPFTRPAAEDHPAATSSDGYKRRVLTSTIEVRNLGGSP